MAVGDLAERVRFFLSFFLPPSLPSFLHSFLPHLTSLLTTASFFCISLGCSTLAA
jgi:hypothetical protein